MEIAAAGNVVTVTVLPDVPVIELLEESLMTRFAVSQSTNDEELDFMSRSIIGQISDRCK